MLLIKRFIMGLHVGIKKRYSLYMDVELLELMKLSYGRFNGVESFNEYCVRKLREGFFMDLKDLEESMKV